MVVGNIGVQREGVGHVQGDMIFVPGRAARQRCAFLTRGGRALPGKLRASAAAQASVAESAAEVSKSKI